MQRKPFGQTREGQAVEAITLDNGQLSCTFLTYGATLIALNVPDKEGNMVDVALGYDTLADYENQDKYLGPTASLPAALPWMARSTPWPSTTGTTTSTAAPPASPPGCGRPKRYLTGFASPITARTWRRASPAPSPPR